MKENRSFLRKVVSAGIDLGEIRPVELLEHVTPEMIARTLPVEAKAKLLGASLDAREMTPELVIEVVGVDVLVDHCPVAALWGCVQAAVERGLQGGSGEPKPRRSARARRRPSPASPSPVKAADVATVDVPMEEVALGAAPAPVPAARLHKRASTETDEPTPIDVVPAKPNARVEFDEAVDQLVADEPSTFDDAPSLFDIDTKVGGPDKDAFTAAGEGDGEWHEDDTSPGQSRRRGR